jgi:predicted AAA+ superfamily ATPase
MANRDLDQPGRGELMDREDDNMPTVGGIFSRLSRFPFFNLRQQKKLESVRRVVQEEEGLWNDLFKHRLSFNRLKNIKHILAGDTAAMEANAIAEQNRLAEEKRKAEARKADDRIFKDNKRHEGTKSRMQNKYEQEEQEIQRIEQQKRRLKAQKEFEESQKPPPEPVAQPDKQKSSRRRIQALRQGGQTNRQDEECDG